MSTLAFLLVVMAFFSGIAFGRISGRGEKKARIMRHLREELDDGEGYGRGRDDA